MIMTILMQDRIEAARKEFIEQSTPYIEAIHRIKSSAFGVKYLYNGNTLTPIYNPEEEKLISEYEFHINVIKDFIIKDYKLDKDVFGFASLD